MQPQAVQSEPLGQVGGAARSAPFSSSGSASDPVSHLSQRLRGTASSVLFVTCCGVIGRTQGANRNGECVIRVQSWSERGGRRWLGGSEPAVVVSGLPRCQPQAACGPEGRCSDSVSSVRSRGAGQRRDGRPVQSLRAPTSADPLYVSELVL